MSRLIVIAAGPRRRYDDEKDEKPQPGCQPSRLDVRVTRGRSCFEHANCDLGYPDSYCFGTGATLPTFMTTGMATFLSQF